MDTARQRLLMAQFNDPTFFPVPPDANQSNGPMEEKYSEHSRTYTMEIFSVRINHTRLIIGSCYVCVCVRAHKRFSKVQRISYL